jgi:hypothetical protein
MILVVIVGLSALPPVQAEPLGQTTEVQITSPGMNETVRGRVPVIGSASVPNFQFYKLEFGVGPNPSQWAVIGSLRDSPVINGQLEVWDTTGLPDGVYTLQLQAVKQDGNWESFFVRGITIANTQPSATPTPDEEVTPTETPSGTTPTPPPAGEAATGPRPTATVQIIQPTVSALSMPTVTPTLSRPDQRELLPVNPTDWREAFMFGAVTMGAVFIVVGLVFGLRRLL